MFTRLNTNLYILIKNNLQLKQINFENCKDSTNANLARLTEVISESVKVTQQRHQSLEEVISTANISTASAIADATANAISNAIAKQSTQESTTLDTKLTTMLEVMTARDHAKDESMKQMMSAREDKMQQTILQLTEAMQTMLLQATVASNIKVSPQVTNVEQDHIKTDVQSNKNPAKRASAFAFTASPLTPRVNFIFKGEMYSTKLVQWEPHQEAYVRDYVDKDDVNKHDEEPIGISSVKIRGVIDTNPMIYEVIGEPWEDDDIYEAKHHELFQLEVNLNGETKSSQFVVSSDGDSYIHLKASAWKIDRFIKLTERIRLESDAISDVRTFYDRLATICRASLVSGAAILPKYELLQPAKTLREMILPDKGNYYYSQVVALLDLLSSNLADLLSNTKVISESRSKWAAMYRDTCTSRDGLDILNHILHRLVPKLGADFQDIGLTIASLDIVTGEFVSAFMTRAVAMQTTIEDAGVSTAPNALLKRLLSLLRRHPSVMFYISEFTSSFSRHQRKLPDQVYQEKPATALLEHMIDNGIDMNTARFEGNRTNTPSTRQQTGFRRDIRTDRPANNVKPRTPFTPRVAAMDMQGSRVEFDLDSSICQDIVEPEESDEQNQVNDNDMNNQEKQEHMENLAEISKMLTDHPALINSISTDERKLCGTCEGRHSTCRCYYLREGNMPMVLQRRIKQFRVRLKDLIAKMDAEDAKKDQSEGESRLPNPRTARIPPPRVSAITAEQIKATKSEVPSPTTASTSDDFQPYVMSIDEQNNVKKMDELLKEYLGDDCDEIATPAVNAQSTQSSDMIVDFEEGKEQIVPIFPEFEDDLVPSDYDAYGGGALNW